MIYFGSRAVSSVYIGTTPIQNIAIGDEPIYEQEQLITNFIMADEKVFITSDGYIYLVREE